MADTYTPTAPSSFPSTISVPATTDPVTGGVGGAANVAGEDNADNIQWLYEQRLIDYTAQIEAASGGRATVIEDDNGNWNVMARIPAFTSQDLDSDLSNNIHPAFYEGATLNNYIYIGLFQCGDDGSGNLVSQPMKEVSIDTFSNHKSACSSLGAGWHMMTIHEYGALCLLSRKIVDVLHGNTDAGYSHLDAGEVGVRYGSGDYIYSGSGPIDWRHDGQPFGIADLVGNKREFVNLFKTVNSKLYFPATNDYTMVEGSWTDQGVYYEDNGSGTLRYTESAPTPGSTATAFFATMSTNFSVIPSVFSTNSLMCELMLSSEWYKSSVWTGPTLLNTPSIPGKRSCTIENATHYATIGGDSTETGTDLGLGYNYDEGTSATGACRLAYIP